MKKPLECARQHVTNQNDFGKAFSGWTRLQLSYLGLMENKWLGESKTRS